MEHFHGAIREWLVDPREQHHHDYLHVKAAFSRRHHNYLKQNSTRQSSHFKPLLRKKFLSLLKTVPSPSNKQMQYDCPKWEWLTIVYQSHYEDPRRLFPSAPRFSTRSSPAFSAVNRLTKASAANSSAANSWMTLSFNSCVEYGLSFENCGM